MVRYRGGRFLVNPLTALDYTANGVTVRRFSIDVALPSGLIRPLHRPTSALVDAFSKHLQAYQRWSEPLEVILGADDESIKLTASAA